MKGREQGALFLRQGVLWRICLIIAVLTQLIACGSVLDALPGAGKSGSKSGSSSLTPTQSVGTLSGVAKDALIRNATVNAYAWNGAKGELLGSGKTDNRGSYSLTLQARSQSVLLEVTGGEYEEEVTGKDISLTADQVLYALQNYTSGQSLTTAITYYTTLATGLAENLVRLGMKPPDAVEEANARLSNVIGLDTRRVRPTDILDPDSTSVPELEYGFATAALSSLTERASILNDSEPHGIFTSVRFIQAAYEDVRADGVLNGRGGNGDVAFGRIRLSPQIYRHELALHILRIANNKTANRTGRGPKEMFDLAKRLNDSTDPIFGGDPVIAIDSDKPNVSVITAKEFPNLPNNAVVFGGLSLNVMVVAFPGVERAELLADDRIVGTATDPENPSISLNTRDFGIGEGRHTLIFRVTDISGAVGESPALAVNVSNQQTAIESISIEGQLLGEKALVPVVSANIFDPASPQTIRYSAKSRDANAFFPLVSISVSAGATMVQSMASVDLRQAALTDGDATFKVEVTNSVGFIFSREVPFTVDLIEPVLNIPTTIALNTSNPNDLQGQYFDEKRGMLCTPMQPTDDSCLLYARRAFDIVTQVSDNRALDSVMLAIDGKTIGQPRIIAAGLTAAPTFNVSPSSFLPPQGGAPDGQRTIMITATDKAGNSTSDGRQIVFDVTPPTLASPIELTPIVGSNGGSVLDGDPVVLKGTFNVVTQLQDNFGFSSATLLLDETPIGRGQVNQGASVVLAANNLNTAVLADGLHTLSVTASDRAGNQLALDTVSSGMLKVRVDNTPPVIAVTGLVYDGSRCRLEGSVSDDRFDSLEFGTNLGLQATITSGGTGDSFSIGLGNATTYTLDARDVLGNASIRTFEFETTTRFEFVQGILVMVPDACELSESDVRLFRTRIR